MNTLLKNYVLKHKSKESALTLLNQILKSFLEWHIFEPRLGFVPILKPVVEELFTAMSKEQIIKIAANTANQESENSIYFMKGKIGLDSFLSWLENRMKNSSIQVSHTFMPVVEHTRMLSSMIYVRIGLYF